MVSSSDAAKQVRYSTEKFDVQKSRAGNADDAFRQIFADVAKAKDIPAPDAQQDVSTVHENRAQRSDTAQKAQDKKDDLRTARREDNDDDHRDRVADAKTSKPEKTSVHKKDAADKADKCSHDDDEDDKKVDSKEAASTDTPADAAATTPTQDASAVQQATPADDIVTADNTGADTGTGADAPSDTIADTDIQPQTQDASDATPAQNLLTLLNAAIAAQNSASESKNAAATSSDKTEESASTGQKKEETETKDLTFRPVAAAEPDAPAKDNVKKTASVGDKPSLPPLSELRTDKRAEKIQRLPQEIRAALKEVRHDDTVSDNALDKLVQKADALSDAQAAQASKKQDFRDASAKQANLQGMLQTAASADKTSPAAGDRAISAALNAAGSPAPAPNGSSGGGSPTSEHGVANALHALNGLENLQAKGAVEPGNFAAALRGSKETGASLMQPTEQVAVQLHHMAKSGSNRFDLQLHPAELGRVDIRLDISKDGTVMATITADNQQTYDMLQKDSRSLERALQQAGLQTDSGSLSFNLRSGDNQQTAQQQAGGQQNSAWSRWMDKTLPEEEKTKTLVYDVGSNTGRVNLMV